MGLGCDALWPHPSVLVHQGWVVEADGKPRKPRGTSAKKTKDDDDDNRRYYCACRTV